MSSSFPWNWKVSAILILGSLWSLFSLCKLGSSLIYLGCYEISWWYSEASVFFIHCGAYSLGPFNLQTHVLSFEKLSCIISQIIFSLHFLCPHYPQLLVECWTSKIASLVTLSFLLMCLSLFCSSFRISLTLSMN